MEGYAIIKHQIFGEISDDEVLKLLPNEQGIPKYRIFDIKRDIIEMENIHKLDSMEFRIYQKNYIDTVIKPFLNEHPSYKVLYLGTATIPLALHLGYCFGSWRDVDVYLLHREQMTWRWSNDNPSKELSTVQNFVKEEFLGPIEIIYKVEATYRTQENDFKEVVENPSKTIGLQLVETAKDAFRNQDQLKTFAHQFALGIDSVANYLPNADKIHLFPTVPVGLAFLMGTKINPNVTKPIVTYQYNTNHTPKYEQILILQESQQQEVNISEDDQKFIIELKTELRNEVESKLTSFVESKIEEKRKLDKRQNWISTVMPLGDYSEMERGYWKNIIDITETVLSSSKLISETDKASDGFFVSEKNEWQINDRFIFNICARLGKDKHKILRALRMFIFHEALHIRQGLTNNTATYIGRFPRVLEEADYIADVWAMIHEYSFSKVYYATETKDFKNFFLEMIDIATKTMWAFDDLDSNTDEMQIRRINRYLIWYWNNLQIDDRSCTTLENIVSILANKPLIEIRGLDIRAQAQRTIFKLTNFKAEDLELAYLDPNTKIVRVASSGGITLTELVKGFKERNGDKIIQQLRSWFHQIRS